MDLLAKLEGIPVSFAMETELLVTDDLLELGVAVTLP